MTTKNETTEEKHPGNGVVLVCRSASFVPESQRSTKELVEVIQVKRCNVLCAFFSFPKRCPKHELAYLDVPELTHES